MPVLVRTDAALARRAFLVRLKREFALRSILQGDTVSCLIASMFRKSGNTQPIWFVVFSDLSAIG